MGGDEHNSMLRAALRLSLRATSRTSLQEAPALSSSTNEARERQDPAFRRLVEGIIFSRKFTLTYHLVLFGVLTLFTLLHWGRKIRRWRRRKHIAVQSDETPMDTQGTFEDSSRNTLERSDSEILDEEGERHSSSSGSTLQGTVSPPGPHQKPVDESSFLLARSPPSGTAPLRKTPYSCLRAWLMYQPRPILIIRKILPSNIASIAVACFIGLNAFYTFYQVHLSLPTLFIFADRAALMFVVNLPLLYLLAAKNQPIKILTGHSYESLNIVHRRLGELMCLLALLHSGGMFGVWWTLLRPVGLSFVRFALSKIILLGIAAFVAYQILYLTSLASFRQKWYELFLGLHVVFQSAALVLLWFHHHNSRVYVVLALGIWAIDRMVYRLVFKTKQLQATLEIMRDGSTVSLRARVPMHDGSSRLRRSLMVDIAGGWRPTEHLFLNIPTLAPKHILQAHPFTIASLCAPSASEAELYLIIRAQDGFSKDILDYAKYHAQVNIRVDGPYGSQTAYEMLLDSDLAVIVAGGSGIAVAWPLVKSVQQRSTLEGADLETFAKLPRKQILLVWVVHQRSQISWIGESNMRALTADGVDVILPEPTADCGRPDVSTIVRNWVEEHDTIARGTTKRRKTGIVCSGPDGMNRAVRNTCSAMVASGRDANVEVEKFGW
ncbi:MAG: hypothetical protein M1812_000392 [Candelaria pacifica]|nr:MAG: hypothetical protein M1812_000392 [Candelaria pacifica]